MTDFSKGGFMEHQLAQMKEMIDGAINHASIYTWGWFNEGPSDHVGACPAYGACADYARGRDPTRFGTWASDKGSSDKCLAHASLLSFNSYPAWYNSPGDLDCIAPFWENLANKMAAGTSSSEHGTLRKPFVISETGAGGIFEWDRNASDAKGAYPKWSLGYQGEVISRDVDVAIKSGNISGITLVRPLLVPAAAVSQSLEQPRADHLRTRPRTLSLSLSRSLLLSRSLALSRVCARSVALLRL